MLTCLFLGFRHHNNDNNTHIQGGPNLFITANLHCIRLSEHETFATQMQYRYAEIYEKLSNMYI